MQQALERHKVGDAHVVPIILRPVAWKETPIGELQVLPTEGKPITAWRNRDEAFQDVVRGVKEVVRILRAQKTKEQWIAEGDAHYRTMRYHEALAALNQASRLDPNDILLPYLKERVLHEGFRCNEEQYLAYVKELADINERLLIDPHEADYYYQKSQILTNLQRHDEALDAIKQAIHLDPTNRTFYGFKGYILSGVGSWEDAVVIYDQLIHLDPKNAYADYHKSFSLHFLGRRDEALIAIDQAMHLDPSNYELDQWRDIILDIPHEYGLG